MGIFGDLWEAVIPDGGDSDNWDDKTVKEQNPEEDPADSSNWGSNNDDK